MIYHYIVSTICSEKSELEQWNSRVDEMVQAIREAKEESKYNMSRVIRKPDICLCENKGPDQHRSNCEADLRLCFGYKDSTTPLLPKSEISGF